MKKKIGILLFWLLFWQIGSMIVNQTLLLPSPRETFFALSQLIITKAYWQTIFTSLTRIFLGFLAGMGMAIFLAFLSARFSFIEDFLDPFFYVIRSTPVASFTILVLVWIKTDYLSIFISFLMVLPIMYENILQGIFSIDKDILEMAKVFSVDRIKKLLYIYIPYILPYFVAGITTSLGFSFKAGVAAEVIGHASHSIGLEIYNAKILLDTANLFAWTMTIVFISYIIEKVTTSIVREIVNREGLKEGLYGRNKEFI